MGNERGGELLSLGLGAVGGVAVSALLQKRGAPPQDIKSALERIDESLLALAATEQAILNALVALNDSMASLGASIASLGGKPTQFKLYEFKKPGVTVASKTGLEIFKSDKPGSLLWFVIDVSDSNADVLFRIDDLEWRFTISTMVNEGLDQPVYPGVWLAKADAAGHYVLMLSAGNMNGLPYFNSCGIYLSNTSDASETLNEARGIYMQ